MSNYPPLGVTEPLVPPLYQSAVYRIPDHDARDRIYNAEDPGFIYARDAHPNARALSAKLARDHHALSVVDNTFASPALCRPLELGADLVMESLTKMLAGHSDVTLGLVVGNDGELMPKLQAASTIWGFSANPFDCWLAER